MRSFVSCIAFGRESGSDLSFFLGGGKIWQ
jgi:hypothetical protein